MERAYRVDELTLTTASHFRCGRCGRRFHTITPVSIAPRCCASWMLPENPSPIERVQ